MKGLTAGNQSFPLPFLMDYGKILTTRGRGVVANMRPCQGRDRGFEPRRSRQSKETFKRGSFVLNRERRYHKEVHTNPAAPITIGSLLNKVFCFSKGS